MSCRIKSHAELVSASHREPALVFHREPSLVLVRSQILKQVQDDGMLGAWKPRRGGGEPFSCFVAFAALPMANG